MFEGPCGGPSGVVFEGCSLASLARLCGLVCAVVMFEGPRCRFFRNFSSPLKVIHAHFYKSRLCKKMCTVIAVILHPSRAPKMLMHRR